MFSDFTRKKMFCSKMVGEWGGGEDGEGTGLAAPMSPLSIRQGLLFFKEEF